MAIYTGDGERIGKNSRKRTKRLTWEPDSGSSWTRTSLRLSLDDPDDPERIIWADIPWADAAELVDVIGHAIEEHENPSSWSLDHPAAIHSTAQPS